MDPAKGSGWVLHKQKYKGSNPPNYPAAGLIKPGKETYKNNRLEKFDINSKNSQAVAAWANRNNPFDTTRTFIGTEQGVTVQVSEDVVSQGEPSHSSRGSQRDSSPGDIEDADNGNLSESSKRKGSKTKPLRNPFHAMMDAVSRGIPSYKNDNDLRIKVRCTIPFYMGALGIHEVLKISGAKMTHRFNAGECTSPEGRKKVEDCLVAEMKDHEAPVRLDMIFFVKHPASNEELEKAALRCIEITYKKGLFSRLNIEVELGYSMHSEDKVAEEFRIRDRVMARGKGKWVMA